MVMKTKYIEFSAPYTVQLLESEIAPPAKGEVQVKLEISTVSGGTERANFVGDLWEQSKFFFATPEEYDEKSVRKRWNAETPQLMNELIEVISGIEDFSCAKAEEIVIGWITEKGYNMGAVMNAFRLTVVGECKGPHMFDITELIGREETISRIRLGIERLG